MTTTKVIMNDDIIKVAPHCSHGPTILFEQHVKNKHHKYYACSANRDRKCSFRQPFEKDKISTSKKSCKTKKYVNYKSFCEQMNDMKKLKEKDRRFCQSCGIVVEKNSKHKNHNVKVGIKDEDFNHIYSLIDPISDNKTKAQYAFCDSSINLINEVLLNASVKGIICVGTPNIHEKLKKDSKLNSFLLDIDERIINLSKYVYPDSAAHYNMFNHHFFDAASKDNYKRFISDFEADDLAILVDPPFGGLVQLLMYSLNCISRDVSGHCYKGCFVKTFIIAPYFLEKKICKSGNEYVENENLFENKFHMVDCQIDYKNHKRLKKRTTTDETSSIVRLFTNVAPSKIKLPLNEGYKYCKECQRYVNKLNKHCFKCAACTTKVGATYKHCDKCQTCVKPTWSHCEIKGVCVLQTSNSKRKH